MKARCFLVPFLVVAGISLAEEGGAIAEERNPLGDIDLSEQEPPLAGQMQLDDVLIDRSRDLAPDSVLSSHISHILFINRCVDGCTIKPGFNDARVNSSAIPSATSVLTEFPFGDETFNQVVDCVREVYAPYDINIVTVDPGTADHHEAILAGTASELVGYEPDLDGDGTPDDPRFVGGVAPSGCEPSNNVISYSFAANTFIYNAGSVERMCWTVAQESAHSFGLRNHVFDCHDPMTYLDGDSSCSSSRKYFRNVGYPCGESMERPCSCDIAVQNSHLELRAVFGDGTPPPPPQVEMLLPAEGASVVDNFGIFANAIDDRLVFRVALFFNGHKVADKDVNHGFNSSVIDPQHSYGAPDWPDGRIKIEVKAYNDLGSEGIASVNVVKGVPCTDESTCFSGQECIEGGCTYPAPTQNLGDTCEISEQCIEGGCAESGGEQKCAQTCNPSVSGGCPSGNECLASGFCWPESDTGGCCAVAGGHKRGPLPWAAVGLFVLTLAIIRRRSHRA